MGQDMGLCCAPRRMGVNRGHDDRVDYYVKPRPLETSGDADPNQAPNGSASKHAVHFEGADPKDGEVDTMDTADAGRLTPAETATKLQRKIRVLSTMIWLTDQEAESAGLPALGHMDFLQQSPWIWEGSEDEQLMHNWERVTYPWTPQRVDWFIRQFDLHGEEGEGTVGARVVQHLLQGKMYFVRNPDHDKGLAQVVPMLCVRVVTPSGKFLVQTSKSKLLRGFTYVRRTRGESLDETDQWIRKAITAEWPKLECAQPKNVFSKAREILQEWGIPDIYNQLSFHLGEIAWTEDKEDKYLGIPCRFCQHFVNAYLHDPVPAETALKLGIDEGGFSTKTEKTAGHHGGDFEWWDAQTCDEYMPGGGSVALEESSVPKKKIRGSQWNQSDAVPLELFDHMTPYIPWTEDNVKEVLTKLKVDINALGTVQVAHAQDTNLSEIASNLTEGTWILVTDKKVPAPQPNVALLQADGHALFLPRT